MVNQNAVHYCLAEIVLQPAQAAFPRSSQELSKAMKGPLTASTLTIAGEMAQTQLSKLRSQPSCHQMEIFGDSTQPHHHPVVSFIGAFLIIIMTGECY